MGDPDPEALGEARPGADEHPSEVLRELPLHRQGLEAVASPNVRVKPRVRHRIILARGPAAPSTLRAGLERGRLCWRRVAGDDRPGERGERPLGLRSPSRALTAPGSTAST
jgi:hypothetical protein